MGLKVAIKGQIRAFEREHTTNIAKSKRDAIMKELLVIVEKGQIIGVTHSQLAEEFKVRRQTIAEYLKEIYASLPAEEVTATRVKLETLFNSLFREAQILLLEATNPREKKEAIDLLLRMMDKFTDFLERFELKSKVADKINVVSSGMDIDQVSLSILERYK